ncbi:hypothetical protein [Cupriavidus sp. UYPR2.512]|uniref:hypothetical protein n=1 Tax=Cupriavidus sp. UYPR2.512 TaxID=1080187 RepID=UPI00035E8550|nr:hypothetical protein [Cupriavidus sp. UYPR2.512]UIF91167.1 hypothetical protein KAF44_34040 [Cupriavidus necator]
MMDCRPEHVGAASWHLCPDPLQVPGARLRALVQARLVDEISLGPVTADVVATPDLRLALHVAPRIGRDGMIGLAGRPESLFPGLALAAAAVPMHVTARGYLPLDLDGTLGPFGGFPENFAALDHGDVFLHRTGVAFKGRVVQRGTPQNLPLAGATVEIDGLWPTYPPPNVMPAAVMEPADVVALSPGFYGSHATATLSRCDVVDDLPQAKRLLLTAAPGTRRLRLDNRGTLVAGMPLRIDADDAARGEVIGIHAVDTSLSADQPAWIELDHPLKHLHRRLARVVPASIPATHDPRNLSRAAQPGDPCAFLTAAAPWAALSLVQVDDGVGPPEFQRIARYAASADADGYFRLPRISRLALFRLRATHPAPPQPLRLTIEPDYGLAEQVLTVAFE